jgi:ABC-2 type transport system permease protein
VRRIALLLGKDLRVLARSPLLLGVLVTYPLVVAVLVGLVAGYANTKPRVALVDLDHLPATVTVGGHVFHVDTTIDEIARNVKLVRLGPDEAERQLRDGRLVATLTVPPGFVADLKGQVVSPRLILEASHGGIAPRVEQQVQALVYELNRRLQEAYIGTNLGYMDLILHGGSGEFLGRPIHVLGLDRARALVAGLPPGARRDKLADFVHDARLALAQTGNALRATANPITLEQAPERGRTWSLSAQVQAYALGLTITFLALVLAAGALAAERDENVLGRLARGLARLGEIVSAKVALAAVVSAVLGLAIALVFGVIIEIGGVTGGEPWQRVPLLVVGLLLAGASLGALGSLVGALAREARAASLVAVLLVMPIVFLGLVPPEIAPAAGWVSDALPFVHAVRFFVAALYDDSPWAQLWREAVWLVGLGLVFGVLARRAMSRMLA